jgi:hypothetical protein
MSMRSRNPCVVIHQTASAWTSHYLAATDRLSDRRSHVVGEVPNGMRAELLEEVALAEHEGKRELGALQMLGGQLAKCEGSSGHGRARMHAGRNCQEAISIVGPNLVGRETNYYGIYSYELVGFQSGTTA